MRKILTLVLLATLTFTAAAAAWPLTEDASSAGMRGAVEETLTQLFAGARTSALAEGFTLERTPITAEVAHYQLDLPVGPGEHDVIRLHRIVRERWPWLPAAAPRAVFLVHGDAWAFEANYLRSLATPAIPDSENVSVFLAERGIDVWGIDFRWALVPAETTDLSFMADWGFATSLGDLDLALAVVRSVRALTGSGFGKLHLLGWSRGGQLGWAQLGAETQRPAALRHVRGFIAMDHTFKTDDEAIRLGNCASYASVQAQLDAGEVASSFGVVAEIGDLATTAPGDPSPYFPSLSNAELAEWLGASVAGGSIPYLHSVGGLVDPDTFVTELLYTAPAQWFAYLSGVAAYQPLRINLDGAAIVCNELDSPFDDHFAEISVPVLYIGAAGSYGAAGIYSTIQIASTDVTTLIVSEAAAPEEDWGHNDLFLADDADSLVWQPILDWIETH
jgi:hypothetical protein